MRSLQGREVGLIQLLHRHKGTNNAKCPIAVQYNVRPIKDKVKPCEYKVTLDEY